MEKHNNSESFDVYIGERMREHIRVFNELMATDSFIKVVKMIGDKIIDIFEKKGALYLCGNGGSASDAQHIAAEFVGRFFRERKALNAEALSINTSTITAVANDYDFGQVFVRQLEAKGKEGDLLIGISTSGTSENVMNAIKYAKANGIYTVLLTGANISNENAENIDYIVKIPTKNTPRIQEVHIFVGHVLAEYVEQHICYNG